MEKNNIKPSKVTVFAYSIFCFLVATDFLMSIFSKTHMNAYGNIRGGGDAVLRFLPGLCLLFFYSHFFFSLIRFGEVKRLAVLIHSGLFIFLGLGLAIPFMGLILSTFTPVALVYMLLIVQAGTSYGYLSVVTLAIIFSLINLWIMIVEYKNKSGKNYISGLTTG